MNHVALLIGTERGDVRTQTLDNVVFHPAYGQSVRLADIATVREKEGPTKIEHLEAFGIAGKPTGLA
ncbi:hypothetical protein L0152_04270, partial [bacterium]|nr:hypothetical protein [bacterium]